MKKVRKTIVIVAAINVMMLFVTDTAAPDLLTHLLDDVVLALEEPEPAAAVRQVPHVIGGRLDEAVHLVDQLRDEGRSDRDDHREHEQVGDPDRQPAVEARAALDPVDEG